MMASFWLVMVVFGLVLLGNALAAPEEQVLTEKGARR
jgi:hypothetical protein